MTSINLLPWREERRELIKRDFLIILGGMVSVAALLVLLVVVALNGAIDSQKDRNSYIKGHIKKLNKEVAEIKDLEKRRQQVLDRMTIIQDLQGTRPLIVRVFDETVRTLPDGLFYTKLSRRGNRIEATGIAESNSRVSSLMRKLDKSPWFSNPNLTAVSAAPAYGDQASNFKMSYKISAPSPVTKAGN